VADPAPDPLRALIAAAFARRDAGDYVQAIRLFRKAEIKLPRSPEIKHNLAMAHYAARDPAAARIAAGQAVALSPALWQSNALLARIARERGEITAAGDAWRAVLRHSPGNGTALLGLADLAMNEFGDPEAAIGLVGPLHRDAHFGVDAELTSLMAGLYTGGQSAEVLSDRLKAFAAANLTSPRLPPRAARAARRRIGLISPLLSVSPVYYLTWSTWAAVAKHHDIVVFDRGVRQDWATERLQHIAHEWHPVTTLEAPALTARIAEAEIDVLFDLGGWSDVVGLAALSAKPAARMYKWVGGQSATTGLGVFDGFIGDEWQSGADLAGLYAEPIVNILGGYIDYTPPDALLALRDVPRTGVALVGNPAKIGPGTIAAWPQGVERVSLIDRRYVHERPLTRVTELLARAGITVTRTIVPEGQVAYLQALAAHEAIVNTQPYAAGLTAAEAHALGIRVLASGAGRLFSARHHLSHARTGGRNASLPAQILALIAR
jgi:tetratricopeptide (TPR) repeat protein